MSLTATRQVQVAGLSIEVLDIPGLPGRAPLVLLHEGLGSIGLWREFPALLQEVTGRRLIAFSRYGHGRSSSPRRPRTPTFFHEEALEVLPVLLQELDARAPVLVGHSDGASIALIHAAHRQVSALVLLAPHVVVEEVTVEAIQKTREVYEGGDLRERMRRHHDDPDAAFWGWCNVWLNPAFRTWNLEREVGEIAVPTLLIQGADDPYGSLDQLTRIQALMRGPVQRLVLPGGHSPHLEQDGRVVHAIDAFLGHYRGGAGTRSSSGAQCAGTGHGGVMG